MPDRRTAAALVALIVAASLLAHASPVAAQQGGEDQEDARTYPDTPTDTYYSEPVAQLAEQGVFADTLCESGFCPHEAIDRKTMAVWVVRMLDGQEPASVSESRFSDVDVDGFHAPFIERMFEIGVTKGCGDGSGFCSDRPVTRAQMAVFLSRAYDLPDGPEPGFSDVPVDAWYATDVAKLAASGITKGCGDGTGFCPSRDTTRAQMATFLWRATGLDPIPDARLQDDSECSFSTSAPKVAASVFQVITDSGTGTAFYIGNDEFMTAAHVVDGVGAGEVRLRSDNRDLAARIVGADFETDIAVLAAPGGGIAPLSFGSVRGLGLGHPLGVVGYPVYETPSASLVTGVLSRTENDDTLGTLVQTDAAINPGNSGGPMIDECGRVLGMAVFKLVGQAIEGISYAISADTLVERLPAAREAGTGEGRSGNAVLLGWETFSGSNPGGPYIGADIGSRDEGAATRLVVTTPNVASVGVGSGQRCPVRSPTVMRRFPISSGPRAPRCRSDGRALRRGTRSGVRGRDPRAAFRGEPECRHLGQPSRGAGHGRRQHFGRVRHHRRRRSGRPGPGRLRRLGPAVAALARLAGNAPS